MTTLEELLTMMAEDAAKAVKPEKRPPPIPPKKADAIGSDEIESLDDGPVLTTDRLWPSALPRPARRGPPPPPPGRRARGTAPPDTVTSGLIDVRSMAEAYERARAEAEAQAAAAAAAAATPPATADEVVAKVEPEAAPRPVIAEGTRPMPVVEDESQPVVAEVEVEAKAEAKADAKATAAPEKEREKRAIIWPVVARRAAVVVALGGAAALAVTFVVNRVRAEGGAAEPTDYTARLAPREPAAVPVAPVPEPASEQTPEAPAVEPVVIIEPTTITEVGAPAGSEVEGAPSEAVPAVVAPAAPAAPAAASDEIGEPAVAAEVAQPAVARDDGEFADRAGPGAPPPELLADGCFDAACEVTAPRARRPARPAAEIVTAPARLATRPSNSEIASAIFAAQDQIDGCGDVYGASGAVPLKIRIAPSGAITSVSVAQGTTRFRTCVTDIVRRLRMPASLVGTTASFPVLIR